MDPILKHSLISDQFVSSNRTKTPQKRRAYGSEQRFEIGC